VWWSRSFKSIIVNQFIGPGREKQSKNVNDADSFGWYEQQQCCERISHDDDKINSPILTSNVTSNESIGETSNTIISPHDGNSTTEYIHSTIIVCCRSFVVTVGISKGDD
jgi:hypothetical protein